jgi:hypothetical protein
MSAKLFTKVSSSDYINYKKKMTIALTNPSQAKTDGTKYNKSLKFAASLAVPQLDASFCLIYAENYEAKQDYTDGVKYIRTICDPSGNLLPC